MNLNFSLLYWLLSGAWGGAALSDTEVRVRARNAECCRVLMGFLQVFIIKPLPPINHQLLLTTMHIP